MNYGLLKKNQRNDSLKYDLDRHYLSKSQCRGFICGSKYMIDIGTLDNYFAAQTSIPKYISF